MGWAVCARSSCRSIRQARMATGAINVIGYRYRNTITKIVPLPTFFTEAEDLRLTACRSGYCPRQTRASQVRWEGGGLQGGLPSKRAGSTAPEAVRDGGEIVQYPSAVKERRLVLFRMELDAVIGLRGTTTKRGWRRRDAWRVVDTVRPSRESRECSTAWGAAGTLSGLPSAGARIPARRRACERVIGGEN